MLRFQMKKKCINFGSYLDKRHMHFNAMRKINCKENTICLLEKQTLPMFLGLSQTTKSRKFSTERDKGADKDSEHSKFHTDVHNTSVSGNMSSMRLISEDNLRIHWFKIVS